MSGLVCGGWVGIWVRNGIGIGLGMFRGGFLVEFGILGHEGLVAAKALATTWELFKYLEVRKFSQLHFFTFIYLLFLLLLCSFFRVDREEFHDAFVCRLGCHSSSATTQLSTSSGLHLKSDTDLLEQRAGTPHNNNGWVAGSVV